MMLEFDGYEIYEASDASVGLEVDHRVRPHLLVLDIMLPGGMNRLDSCSGTACGGVGDSAGATA